MLSPAEDPLNVEGNFSNPTASIEMFPPINLHKSQPPLVSSIPPSMKLSRGPFNSTVANIVNDRDPNQPSFIPDQQFQNSEIRNMISKNQAVFPNKQPLLLPLNQSSQAQATPLPPQFLHQKAQENFLQPPVSASYNEPAPPLNYVTVPQGPLRAMPPAQLNLLPVNHPRMPFSNVLSSTSHLPRGAVPPLPLVPPPPFAALPGSQGPGAVVSNQVGGGAYSGLINTLMAQGLISLANQAPVQVGDKSEASLLVCENVFCFLALENTIEDNWN